MENKLQTLTVEDRRRLTLCGVKSVDVFTEDKIKLKTIVGGMNITGKGLKINLFSEGTGAFSCEGVISSVVFIEQKIGFVKRFFK